MKQFINPDFLLTNKYSRELYHSYAEKLSICDYHCHLVTSEIANDKAFSDITELWLSADHYKWRAMRFLGVEEEYITGQASPKDKFLKWAESVPKLIGNPLYHFSHLELARYFEIYELLCKENAEKIWSKCNERIKDPDFTARNLIKKSNVTFIGTTDDPADSLVYHKQLREDNFSANVTPTFRPDNYIQIKSNFKSTINKLGSIVGTEINSFKDYLDSIEKRVKYFNDNGCLLADFSFEIIDFEIVNFNTAEQIFNKVMNGVQILISEKVEFQSYMLVYLGHSYSSKNWVMQIHVGSQRDNSNRNMNIIGMNSGFDSINDKPISLVVSKLLNILDITDQLPKTIIYTMDPSANAALSSLIGSFQGENIAGKVQFGSAWWFNDNYYGIKDHLISLSSIGILSVFVGMLTDSRSLISYPRHEYFRRILCQLLGEWMENGLIPQDYDLVGTTISDICFNNIERYISI